MDEEKENLQIRVGHVAILLVFSMCSSSLLLLILPFGLVACNFVLFFPTTFLELAVYYTLTFQIKTFRALKYTKTHFSSIG